MKENKFEFSYRVYNSIDDLPEDQKHLLLQAKEVTNLAYAPYSNFYVGAVARMTNGQLVKGSNQENASYPVGLCAERVLLSTISSIVPQMAIEAIAISYNSKGENSDHPVAPCGICRQSLHEFESRFQKPVQLILGGTTGPVFVLDSVSNLLPLAFTGDELS